jgi:NAD(P)H-dependent FMN reductase
VTVVLLIGGSVRSGSVNQAVLATAAGLTPDGVAVRRYEGLAELPQFNPDLDAYPLPAPVEDLRNAIAEASALLFSTPEYAGTMPGALKTLLEWTVGGVEISHKPCGWINPSTGPTHAVATYATLRTVLGYTGAAVVPEACADVPITRDLIGHDGTITDAGARDAIGRVMRELVARAE